jgi:hypothetical protein
MRAPLFYVLCLVAAAMMVAVAARPVLNRPGAAVEADRSASRELRFTSATLQQLAGGADVAVTQPPGISGALTGVAVAALEPFNPQSSDGARLLLGPQTRASLASSAQTLTVTIEPLPDPDSLPPVLHAGFVVAGAPIVWVSVPLTASVERQTVRLVLPRPGDPPLALPLAPAIDPAGTSDGPGFQLIDLSLTPTAPAAAPPAPTPAATPSARPAGQTEAQQ